jgi:ribonucleoside-diphosphate reductase alpha chain/ribonucleoside-triphosphate reductase
MAFVEDGKLNKDNILNAQRLNARLSYRVTLPILELPKWNAVQVRDRLLGLSLTGWIDMVNATDMNEQEQRQLLRDLRRVARESADNYADELGFNRSELISCVKPEGTISLLPTVSSGLHANHSEYYIRRIRINAQDPLLKACEELGYPIFPEVGQDIETCKTKVVEFPVKSPKGKTKYDITAIEQLEIYKMFMEEYVDHNASNTISVLRDEEWNDVVDWVYDNWDTVIGITFISLDDSFYQLMPYESCTKEEYEERKSKLKPITNSVLSKYERFDYLVDDLEDDSCVNNVCAVR